MDSERIIEVLAELNTDMHNVSNRPCGTCAQLTTLLGRRFGCDYYREYGRPGIGKSKAANEAWIRARP